MTWTTVGRMTTSDHTHQLVYVGMLQGEYGGSYALRWCRVCGTLIEFLGNQAAELIPARTKDAKGAKYEYVKTPAARSKPKARALGRGLRELMASSVTPKKLPGGLS